MFPLHFPVKQLISPSNSLGNLKWRPQGSKLLVIVNTPGLAVYHALISIFVAYANHNCSLNRHLTVIPTTVKLFQG
jgi:hypothetical protein